MHDNSLSLVLFGIFFVILIGMSLVGLRHENAELTNHGQPLLSYAEYLISGSFIEAVFENWESEFLQMGALVVLTIWFTQKGSKGSKKLRGKDKTDTSSRYSIINSAWKNKPRAVKQAFTPTL